MFWPHGFEDDNSIDTVHELWRKLASRRFHCRAIDLLVKTSIQDIRLLSEAQAALDQAGHLAGPQVRGHNNDALREVHLAVVTQGKSGLIENSEQQLW